jgi:hypothetical protein
MTKITKWFFPGVLAIALAAGYEPAAQYLQFRQQWAGAAWQPDAVYLVAGARARARRQPALVAYVRRHPWVAPPAILVANDTQKSFWDPASQRNLTAGEWSIKDLTAALPDLAVERVDEGAVTNTDNEMRALASWLCRHPGIRRVALVTSAYHMRRVYQRLAAHAPSGVEIRLAPVSRRFEDYRPDVVVLEYLKLGRDRAGLGNTLLFARTRWMREGDVIILLLLAVLAYAWVGYPWVLARVAASSRRMRDGAAGGAPPQADDFLPRVAVVFAAYKEAKHIEARLRNLQALDYPGSLISIHVGVDGAEDETAALALRMAADDPRIHVQAFPERRGKSAVLRDLVGAAGAADVLVLTDANTHYRPDALRRLVAPLVDPGVGGVCGRLEFVAGPDGRTHEGSYWNWENKMKEQESAVDSCLGANGAIYAMRRGLFWRDFPANTIVDDLVLGMKVREQGRRFVYEKTAVAVEEMPQAVQDEWRRRVRIGAGDFQALWLCRRCLLPRYGWFAWIFLSHKVLRWVTPHLLLAAMGLTWWLALVHQSPWSLGAAAGWGVHAVCLAGWLGRWLPASNVPIFRCGRKLHYFMAMQAALFAGFIRFCRGNLVGTWVRTVR